MKIKKEEEQIINNTFKPKISSKSNLLAKHSDKREIKHIEQTTPVNNYKSKLEINFKQISNDSSSFNLQSKIREKLNNSSSHSILPSSNLKGLNNKIKIQMNKLNITSVAEANINRINQLRD